MDTINTNDDQRSPNNEITQAAAYRANKTLGSNPAGRSILSGALGADILTDYEAFAQSESDSVRDPLTGLFNRRAFEQKIKELDESPDREYVIIMFDLDHFKAFNDKFGHQAGDSALKRLAHLLTANFRETDFIARYGGEEFVAILDSTPKNIHDKCNEVRNLIEDSHMERERRQKRGVDGHPITSSLGYSTHRIGDGKNADKILNEADVALYVAKNSGRNKVVEWTDGMQMVEN